MPVCPRCSHRIGRNYQQEGLTGAGAALIAVAVMMVMPAGIGALGGALSGSSAAMATAALNSLAIQASISLVNNQGNVGKTFKEMGSSKVVKSVVAAALTAGVLDKLGGTQFMEGLNSVEAGLTQKMTYNLINAATRSITNAAVTGGDITSALKTGLLTGLVDFAHGEVAKKIFLADFDYVTHKLAHALTGCASAAASGKACRDGAIGSAVGEVVAGLFDKQVPAWNASAEEWSTFDAKMRNYGKLVAGTITALAGGDAQAAMNAAENSIDNNSRLAMRARAVQQGMEGPQFWMYMRARSLQEAIIQRGGRVTPEMSDPLSQTRYNTSDIARLEAQLRSLNPRDPLLYVESSANLSALPSAYVNMRYAVNMQTVGSSGSGVNAFGFPRDGSAFFRELLRTNPELFSPKNQGLIRGGDAPLIDAQWIQYNPTHLRFSGTKLVHHHWMQGNIAVPIPEPIHRTWNTTLHPYR